MKPIQGYETIYAITAKGGVVNILTGKLLKPVVVNGYARVSLYKNGKAKIHRVHRLVAMAYIPNPDNLPEVDHIDEDKLNNHVSNLRWCTNQTNCNWYQNNAPIISDSTAKPFKVNGKDCPSIAKFSQLVVNQQPHRKIDTVRKEVRRFLNSSRQFACLYGFTLEKY